jgi:hypothetical protein
MYIVYQRKHHDMTSVLKYDDIPCKFSSAFKLMHRVEAGILASCDAGHSPETCTCAVQRCLSLRCYQASAHTQYSHMRCGIAAWS